MTIGSDGKLPPLILLAALVGGTVDWACPVLAGVAGRAPSVTRRDGRPAVPAVAGQRADSAKARTRARVRASADRA
jgi:hypothetical protein